jgi:hypothetical protein
LCSGKLPKQTPRERGLRFAGGDEASEFLRSLSSGYNGIYPVIS